MSENHQNGTSITKYPLALRAFKRILSHEASDLPNSTPHWDISLFSVLNGSIKLLDNSLTQFNSNLQKSMDTANNALRKAEDNQSTTESLTSKVEHLSDAVEFLLSEIRKQKYNLFRSEVYTRCENLMFRGFNVTRNDSESCEHKVRMILRTMDIPNFDNIPFPRCHYL